MPTKEPLQLRIEPLTSGALSASVDRLSALLDRQKGPASNTNVTWEKGWSADATTSILIDYMYVTMQP